MLWLQRKNSLFVKIFFSFLIVIILLSSFNLLSFTFFRTTIQKEIIQYNQLILQNAAERYGVHFSRLKTLLFDLYHNDKLAAFNRQLLTKNELEINYLLTGDIMKSLRSDVYNPLHYLDNIIIFFHSNGYAIEKEGSSDAEELFSSFYASSRYPYSFWLQQFDRQENYKIYPASEFRIHSSNDSGTREMIPLSLLIPGSNYQIVALIEVEKLLQAFHGEHKNAHFIILNEEEDVIYSSSGTVPESMPSAADITDYKLADQYYYFKEQDEGTKLTFLSVVPYSNIAAQVRKLNFVLALMLAVSVAIGMVVSFFLSKKINSPVKQIISSIMERNPDKLQSSIQEFAFINQKVHDLIKEKEVIENELVHNQSFLTSYNYINKLKMINSDLNEWKEFMAAEEEFTIVLYQLVFRSASFAESDMKPDKAANYIQEHIRLMMSKRLPGSHTFQIEKDQILTVLSGKHKPEELREMLELLKQILDRDKTYCFAFIAVSSTYDRTSQFNEAYQEVLTLVRQAELLDETQLLYEPKPPSRPFVLTPSQEQELYNHLQEGNESACLAIINRMLDTMFKKQAAVHQYSQLAESIAAKTLLILDTYHLDSDKTEDLDHFLSKPRDCHTLEEYKEYFRQFISAVASIVQSKKEQQDPIIDYIMEWLSTKYSEDISLDMLADKLNMSSAYLSVYIKEKTGINFIDHMNGIRMQKAKELLASTALTVTEISQQIGYRNVTSFNRMFKKWTGTSPTEFRKNQALLSEDLDASSMD
ncbi:MULTISPECIES: helix-turn-helix domain-containing protein [unclassified Paenibacillus]|uniref:helix-turn-helix domain-containing protein n=1 Tax=unclassified Paenibacillus TaxID=185978 RepID=UPI0011A524F1|nr:AraC family transcriptional regulator [Paenibacillus sp. 32O-W]